MEQDLIQRYGTDSATVMHPLVLACLVLLSVYIFTVQAKKALVPLIATTIFIPMQQHIEIAGLNFMAVRIMIAACWIAVLAKGYRKIKFNNIDKAMILWVFTTMAGFTLLWQTSGAFVNRLGFAYTALGVYFLFRILLEDRSDIQKIVKALAVMSIILAVCMTIEQVAHRNLFSVFGGVSEIPAIREGRIRSQGPFTHAILAGCFGATSLPLFATLFRNNAGLSRMGIAGMIASMVIVFTSASSGPAVACMAGIAALLMWQFRKHLRRLRWIFFGSLVLLNIVMKAPVWALIGRVKLVGGSTSYHRYNLVHQFITRLNEWWLFGAKSTEHWGWLMTDHANMYVSVGTGSGLLPLVLFIALIVYCYKNLGKRIKELEGDKKGQFFLWAIGAALFAHVVGFMGISYHDQMIAIWYMLLAVIAVVSSLQKNALASTDHERMPQTLLKRTGRRQLTDGRVA